MWSIKEVKNKAKKTLKNNLWTLMIIGLFMTIVIGENVVNKDSFSNLKIIYEYEKEKNTQEIVDSAGKEELANEYLDNMQNIAEDAKKAKLLVEDFANNKEKLKPYIENTKHFNPQQNGADEIAKIIAEL